MGQWRFEKQKKLKKEKDGKGKENDEEGQVYKN